MEKTANGLIESCKLNLGMPYVYGTKGEILTERSISTLAALYPSVFTKQYIEKARTFIGKRTTDCSGLISIYTGKVKGSYQMFEEGINKEKFNVYDLQGKEGYAFYKPGHIGVYIGNDSVIEAKGINYGTIISKPTSTAWTYMFKIKGIDYSKAYETGWSLAYYNNENNESKWRYISKDGNIVKGFKMIENSLYFFDLCSGIMVSSDWVNYKGKWFYFNKNGTIYHDWLYYEDIHGESNWYYLDRNGIDEGEMVTGIKRLQWQGEWNDYYFSEDGKLVINQSILMDADSAGVIKVKESNKNSLQS